MMRHSPRNGRLADRHRRFRLLLAPAGCAARETCRMFENETVEQPDWYRVALSSIGDAVIVTDAQGRVRFMNSVAETLTGWSLAEAAGQPLPPMFRVVHEQTRHPVNNPVVEVIAQGVIVGLASRT